MSAIATDRSAYLYIYISGNIGGQGIHAPTGAVSRDRGIAFDFGGLFMEKTAQSSRSCDAPTSMFEHSNRELLVLYTCGDMVGFVVHKRCHRGPRGSPGVPGASLGRLRDVPGGPRSVPGRPRGVPGGPRDVPRGSQARP